MSTSTFRFTALRKILATAVIGIFVLTGCMTNEETGNPDAWEQILPDEVPEIANMVPEDIVARGHLRMGTNPPFAPFEFKDTHGEIIGVELDLGHALASIMGLEMVPVEQDFPRILPEVRNGSVDFGGSGFTDTEERRKNFDFINTLYAGVQWAQRPGSNIDPENACGLRVAVQRNTVSDTDDLRPKSEECEKQGKEPIEVLAYDSSDNAATALVLGRADAFSADSPVVAWAVERANGEMENTGDMLMAAPYGLAVNKDSQMGEALAAAMDHLIESGDYEKILAQWNITDGLLDEALVNEEPYKKN